jgi:hypothetical protein
MAINQALRRDPEVEVGLRVGDQAWAPAHRTRTSMNLPDPEAGAGEDERQSKNGGAKAEDNGLAKCPASQTKRALTPPTNTWSAGVLLPA